MRYCHIWCPRMSPQLLSSPWPVPHFSIRSILRVSAFIRNMLIIHRAFCQRLLGQSVTAVDIQRVLT